MKQHYPSGTYTDRNGIHFFIPKHWTAQQALAVSELLQDLHAIVCAHYGSQMFEALQTDRCDTSVTNQHIEPNDDF